MANPTWKSKLPFLVVRGIFPAFLGVGLWFVLKDRGNQKAKELLGKADTQQRLVNMTEKEIMIATLTGQGPASLKELREETAKKRQKIAEDYTPPPPMPVSKEVK